MYAPSHPPGYKDDQRAIKTFETTVLVTTIVLLIWGLVGFAGFVMSLVCFGRSGSTSQHVIGLILAILLGPFYWIYFFVSKSYCAKIP